MKLHQLILTFSFLIIALSIAYYLVIFLPQKEQSKIDQEKLELEAKEKILLQNKVGLENCLNDVYERFMKAFEDSKTRTLSLEAQKILIDEFNKQKENCFKKYPQ